MSRGVIIEYIFHDCIICRKTVSVEYVDSYGKLETLPPSRYNRKQTCGPACKSELNKQLSTGIKKDAKKIRKIRRKDIRTYQYILTPMDLYLRGNHLR